MLNEYPQFEQIRKDIEAFVVENVKSKWNLVSFKNLKFVKDINPGSLGSIEPLDDDSFNIRLEPNNIEKKTSKFDVDFEKSLKCIGIHECFHFIFPELDQTNAFTIKDKMGDTNDYLRLDSKKSDYVSES